MMLFLNVQKVQICSTTLPFSNDRVIFNVSNVYVSIEAHWTLMSLEGLDVVGIGVVDVRSPEAAKDGAAAVGGDKTLFDLAESLRG